MLLNLTLIVPLIGGALLPLFKFDSVKKRGWYVEAIVCLTSLMVFAVLLTDMHSRYTYYRMTDALAITFRVDGAGAVFAGLVAILWPIASLYGFEYMNHEERPNSFFAFYTMTYGITLAIAFSGNLFSLYIFYECLTLITLPLVTHKQDTASIRAGRKYLTFSITGAALAFVALVVLFFIAGSTDFVLGGVLTADLFASHTTMIPVAFLLAFIGFGTKAAVFPMHAWLPAASVAPTPVTALLHAVAVVNTGAFAVLRVIYYAFGTEFLAGTWAQAVALILACVTIVFGSSMAVKEQHLKRRLAWSTISNLSYMLMGAALMSPAGMVGSLTHMVMHGVTKITLFYCAGAILVRTGKEYIQDVRGFGKLMPVTCAAFVVAGMSLVGTPPLSGFVSKFNLLTAAGEAGPIGAIAIAALIISAVLTAIYLFTVIGPMYFRPLNADMAHLEGFRRDPHWMKLLPFALLIAMVIGLGLWGGPLVSFLKDVAAGVVF